MSNFDLQSTKSEKEEILFNKDFSNYKQAYCK